MMKTIVYDGTFNGFLTAIFEVYEYKYSDVKIVKESAYHTSIFGNDHIVEANKNKALRVWNGITKYAQKQTAEHLYHAWLSELPLIEKYLLQYIQYLFKTKQPVDADYSHAAVLKIAQVSKKVHRERHCMEAFVRFQLTKDGLYYAVVEPDYNVLPLLVAHFKNRYADQRWLIYDGKRKWGIYYDLNEVEMVELQFSDEVKQNGSQTSFNEEEPLYQSLWKTYFGSVNIKARKNTKLHIQHMPKRYWKHLPEKEPEVK